MSNELTKAELERTKKALEAASGNTFAAAKALGIAESTVRDRRNRLQRKGLAPAPETRPRAGRTLQDFRKQYDKSYIVPTKIRAALQQLGSDGWEYEADFAKMAGVSLTDLGRFRDEFAKHVVTLGRESRRAWAGTAAAAQKMREMLP
jgi:hypothetical protein